MGLDFTLYENKSHNDVEIHKEHTIEEVLYLSNRKAMIIVNWFYRINGSQLLDNFNECKHYIEVSGEEIHDIIIALERVQSTDFPFKERLSYHLFPILYPIVDVNSVEMWSEEYYNILDDLLKDFKQLYPSNDINNRERLFYYNISW